MLLLYYPTVKRGKKLYNACLIIISHGWEKTATVKIFRQPCYCSSSPATPW
uniref:Uncharacterized protein n=1 Tax=Zea mays TaxID=4577 RepID=C4J7F4_MAIZE|nr:unknown [Zea mays]